MAPQYNETPIVRIPRKDETFAATARRIDVAEQTLSAVEKLLYDIAVRTRMPEATLVRTLQKRRWRYVRLLICITVQLGITLCALVFAVQSYVRVEDCVEHQHNCDESALESDERDVDCKSIVPDALDLSHQTACEIVEVHHVLGCPLWRLATFAGLLWPLIGLSTLLVAIIAVILDRGLNGNVIFVTEGPRGHLASFIVSVTWLGAWFLLTSAALSRAHKAEQWNEAAGRTIWPTTFERVHFVTWRLLLVYLLWCFSALLRSIFGKYLALGFHQSAHLERMKTAIVQEDLIRVLSQPCRLKAEHVVQHAGCKSTLHGMKCAHWAALRYMLRLKREYEGISVRDIGEREFDYNRIQGIVDKCSAVACDLSEALAARSKHVGDPVKDGPSPRQSWSEHHGSGPGSACSSGRASEGCSDIDSTPATPLRFSSPAPTQRQRSYADKDMMAYSDRLDIRRGLSEQRAKSFTEAEASMHRGQCQDYSGELHADAGACAPARSLPAMSTVGADETSPSTEPPDTLWDSAVRASQGNDEDSGCIPTPSVGAEPFPVGTATTLSLSQATSRHRHTPSAGDEHEAITPRGSVGLGSALRVRLAGLDLAAHPRVTRIPKVARRKMTAMDFIAAAELVSRPVGSIIHSQQRALKRPSSLKSLSSIFTSNKTARDNAIQTILEQPKDGRRTAARKSVADGSGLPTMASLKDAGALNHKVQMNPRRKELLPATGEEQLRPASATSGIEADVPTRKGDSAPGAAGVTEQSRENEQQPSLLEEVTGRQLQDGADFGSDDVDSHLVQGIVEDMFSYFKGNSHMRVIALGGKDPDSDDTTELTSTVAARSLGYYVFWNLYNVSERLSITERDLKFALHRKGRPFSYVHWQMLDPHGRGFATLEETMQIVEGVYRNRKNLTRTLKDNEHAIRQVELAFGGFLTVVLIFVSVAIFDGGAFQRTWTALSAAILSFSFIFGNSIRQMFENAVFMFCNHPFDNGDMIRFDGSTYYVEEITLINVRLKRVDEAVFAMPLAELRGRQLHNLSRSPDWWDDVYFVCDAPISDAALETVADRIYNAIICSPTLFAGNYRFWVKASLAPFKVELALFYDIIGAGCDLTAKWHARNNMVNAVTRGLHAAGQTYTFPATQAEPTITQRGLRSEISFAGTLQASAQADKTAGRRPLHPEMAARIFASSGGTAGHHTTQSAPDESKMAVSAGMMMLH